MALSKAAAKTAPTPLPARVAALLRESRWLLLAAAALYVVLILYGYHRDDPAWSHSATGAAVHNPGGVFGAWASSMIGISIPSSRLKRFQSAIERGQFLMMVDVPRSRIEDIEELLERAHPEGHFEGTEPNIPAFP